MIHAGETAQRTHQCFVATGEQAKKQAEPNRVNPKCEVFLAEYVVYRQCTPWSTHKTRAVMQK